MLAIDGGDRVRRDAFPKRCLFGERERDAAIRLFDQALLSGDAIGYGGVEEQAYEHEFSEFMGGGYADLVNSGTCALYVALGALRLPVGGEVVVPLRQQCTTEQRGCEPGRHVGATLQVALEEVQGAGIPYGGPWLQHAGALAQEHDRKH